MVWAIYVIVVRWLSAEGAKNVSWPWLFPLRGWGSQTMTSTGKFVQRAHHFILLRLNPFGLMFDSDRWWVEHSMSYLRFCLSAEGLKTFPGIGYFQSEDGVVWLWHPLANLYIRLTLSSCYDSIPLALGLIGRGDVLNTLCHSGGFACQERMLKTFSGPVFYHSKDGVVWLWHLLVNLYLWLTISSWYGSIPLGLGLIGRDTGLSTLGHSCGLAFQQSVLKAFPASGYLHSENGVVRLWHPLVNSYIWLRISSC